MPHNAALSRPILVSSCLLGLCTRWDGEDCREKAVVDRLRDKNIIPVCPEQLGGLPTPRIPAEISSGDGNDVIDGKAKVVNEDGKNVTDNFLKGAEETLKLVRLAGVKKALFKEGSPSCGRKRIKRNGEDRAGCGVTTALLLREGVEVEGIL
jgi:uncharacterized protein YbbK (DUF523 family)